MVDAQLRSSTQRVGHFDRKIAGIAFLAVTAEVTENNRLAGAAGRLPYDLVEALPAAMERIEPGIRLESVLDAVDGEAPARDAIGVASRDRAEMRAHMGIARQRVEAQHDIGNPA